MTSAVASSLSPAVSRRTRLRTTWVRTVGRFDAMTASGGGEIQQSSTEEALRRLGIDARPWRPWEDRLRNGDVLHFFGSRPEFLPLIVAAKQQGARVALSTIAWFDWRNIWREADSLGQRAVHAVRYAARAAFPRLPSWRKRLYEAADVLLPNSQVEAKQLMRLFSVAAHRVRVVPNGIDPHLAAATPDAFRARYGLTDFVLSCGRIEPRKNQLSLIRALKGTGLKLVVIGDAAPGHEAYFAACRAAATPQVQFIGRLRHDDPLLASAYAAASCFALTSWYETPGLAALEAAATGTPLVLPRSGAAPEYFGSRARYVEPGNLPAIRRAVLAAAAQCRSSELAEAVTNQFTWRRAAETTMEAYGDLA